MTTRKRLKAVPTAVGHKEEKISFCGWITAGFLLLWLFIGDTAFTQDNKLPQIRGLYGNLGTFAGEGLPLEAMQVNAIFVRGSTLNSKELTKARAKGVKVYMEFPALNGKSYVKKHPEAWAINRKGEKVEPADWFMGVCPTDPGFKKARRQKLREMLQTYIVDGVWMDYLHWHAQFETPNPILPETCFCDHCISTFEQEAGIEVPEGTTAKQADWILSRSEPAWRDWRCQVIARWVADFKLILEQEQPDALLGIFHCPWTDKAHNGARRSVLGLDYAMLKPYADVFSPMVYHAMMGHEPQWIADNLEWFSQRLQEAPAGNARIWPIVQAYDNPYPIKPDELTQALNNANTGDASGVMLFTGKALLENPEKQNAVTKIYRQRFLRTAPNY